MQYQKTTSSMRFRSTTERLQRIHEMIASGSYPNSAEMAAELEVTTRTIARDVAFMKSHYHVPIAYHPLNYGFYYSDKVEHFPPGAPGMTEAEIFALLIAGKAVAQYRCTPFFLPLQRAFQKLSTQLDNGERYILQALREGLSFRPFAVEDPDLKNFELLALAVSRRQALRFRYRKPGSQRTELRNLHPYHLTCADNRWYIIGHDVDRSEPRTFAVSRVASPSLTGESFVRPKNFDLEEYLRGSLTVMKGEGDYDVVIEFDAWATDHLRHRIFHPGQQITELPCGGSHLRLRLSGLAEVERWVLSWGLHATVIKPDILADRIAQTMAILCDRYTQPGRLQAAA
jgi:proteasome accessory factor B